MPLKHLWLAAVAASLAAGPIHAQELTGTLKKIKDTGSITLGHRDSSIPFSYLDDQQKPVGYALDICMKVVDAVKKELKLDKLDVKMVPVTSSTRIPLIANGTIDLECGSTTNNLERQKQVAFTNTHFLTASRFVSKKENKLDKIDDLKGKTVATAKGSTSEKNIREKAPQAKVDLYDTYADGLQAVLSGRAEALTTDDIILYGFERNSPDKFKVVGGQFTQEPYAAGVKKGNADLLAEVNATLRDLKESGEWAAIYKKWIGTDPSAVPPQNWQDVYTQAPTVPTLIPEQAATATAGAQSAAATAAAAASPTPATTPTP